MFNEIQKQGRKLYIQRKREHTTIQSINQRSYFQKHDCVRQWCKTNGTIKRYNELKRERRKEKYRTEEWEEEREKRKERERKM